MENVHIVKFIALSVRPINTHGSAQGYQYFITCLDTETNRKRQYRYFSSKLFAWLRADLYLKIKVGQTEYESIVMGGPVIWNALEITPIPDGSVLTEERMEKIVEFQKWLMFEDE
jgi:hypothetical protein